MHKSGSLVPDHFVYQEPGHVELNVASIIWGVSIAASFFTGSKAIRQMMQIYKRKQRINVYIILVFAEWLSSTMIGILSWLHLFGVIGPGLEFFVVLLSLWVVQTQCIMQIIINRIALLVRDQRTIRKVKWGVAVGLGLVNISVFVIWTPARLQISSSWIHVNEIWDRIEKVIFCIIDAALNVYFIYLVRSKLISNGLTKYHRLFQFNIFMIFCSVSLDIILIGVMSLGSGFVYVQFHPLVYMLKLHIELNMASLIAKIVKMENGGSYPSSSGPNTYGPQSKSGNKTGNTNLADPRGFHMATLVTANRDSPRDVRSSPDEEHKGIHKTVETVIVRGEQDEDAASRSSSTAELQKQPFV